MKKNLLITLLAISSVALSFSNGNLIQNAQAETKPASPSTQSDEKVQLLFVQNGVSGAFDGKTLSLEGVGSTIFFSDRPERIAGQVTTAEFISHWDEGKDNFQSDPPNATLSILGQEGVNSAVIELTNPKLDGNTLSYDVKILEGTLPKSFKEASLFIDLFGRWAMYSAGVAAGAAAGSYYYHPPVIAAPVYAPAPIYVAPRPIIVY